VIASGLSQIQALAQDASHVCAFAVDDARVYLGGDDEIRVYPKSSGSGRDVNAPVQKTTR